MIKLFFLPLADSESIVIIIFDLSPIRKHVSLAMGLFRIGIKIFLPIASRPPPSTTFRYGLVREGGGVQIF
jgi:hypothetical protein